LYKAKWIDGYMDKWNNIHQNWERKDQNKFVALIRLTITGGKYYIKTFKKGILTYYFGRFTKNKSTCVSYFNGCQYIHNYHILCMYLPTSTKKNLRFVIYIRRM
jgi:hypothetical protein